jgi:hypothetical protein
MPKTLLATTVTILALAVPAWSQSQLSKRGNTTEKLIAISRQYVTNNLSALDVTDSGLILTRSGPMNLAVVKGRASGELESPVVRMNDNDAVVTGLVVFKGHSSQPSGVKIWFIKYNGRWKIVESCLGDCGFK